MRTGIAANAEIVPDFADEPDLALTECPPSHRVARRFFSGLIVTLLLLLATALIYVVLIEQQVV